MVPKQQLICLTNSVRLIIFLPTQKKFIKDSVIRNAERLKTNYRLIKLGSKVPLPFVLYELKYSYNGITTNEVLKGIKLR